MIVVAALVWLSTICQNIYANALTIKLATTDWCPYSCPEDDSVNGLAHDYVTHILAGYEMQADIVSYPWARAIRQVNLGKRHGLLTAVHSESPNLMFTKHPMMSYQMCFYGLTALKWQYTGKDSLADVSLAVIAEYGYGTPVDEYLFNNQFNDRVIELSGDHGLPRLISLVTSKRADVFIEDKNVINWYLKHEPSNAAKQLKTLGCLDETPFYLALSPNLDWAPEVIKLLEQGFKNETNQSKITKSL